MRFKNAQAVENVVWEMKLADYPRALNRAKINDVFNGFPPYTAEEVLSNQISTNVNFLEGLKIAHDARKQFANAFLNPSPLFTVSIDHGPRWKRDGWASTITKEANRILKRSPAYMETMRSVFALNVLHGIGPTVWPDKQRWKPRSRGVEDVLIPSGTELDMENLPMFAVYENYTAQQLRRLIEGPHVDPGWQIQNVEKAIAWVDQEAQKLMSASWPEVWSPEKMSERIKEDSGLYSSDRVPTVDCWRLFYWNDAGKKEGWSQKVVLDAWGEPGVGGAGGMLLTAKPEKPTHKYGFDRAAFLYDAGDRKFSSNLREIIHWQFADASAVAPFRYHSVRSLGFLLYNVCHLQNRLRCKFNDAIFESLMQYFRVNNMGDAERALRINLTDKTPIPDGVQFVRPEERWQINERLAEMGLELNRQTMQDNSAAFTQDYDLGEQGRETATRTMAKVNASASLVNAMLTQAYNYQGHQYVEICRRLCIPNSRDADVREFRLRCLKAGVPEEYIDSSRWTVEPVRVIGSGNKTVQIAMVDKLMSIYTKLPNGAQKELLRLFIAVNTDDYDQATRWVPEAQNVSNAMHDAQLAMGTLMQGLPVQVTDSANYDEEIVTLLGGMIQVISGIEKSGALPSQQQVIGLQTVGQHIGMLIAKVAEDAMQPHHKGLPEDKSVKEKVKAYSDDLAKLNNIVKGYAQKLAEQQQKQGANGQMDPAVIGKIQAMSITAQAKAKLASESHAARTAQKQLSWQLEEQRKQQQHAADMQNQEQEAALDLSKRRLMSLHE